MNSSQPLYIKIAKRLALEISQGIHLPGEKVPSVRQLKRKWEISLTTVMLAYRHLQQIGIICPVPQSGYYVSNVNDGSFPRDKGLTRIEDDCALVSYRDIYNRLILEGHEPNYKHLGETLPNCQARTIQELLKLMAKSIRKRYKIRTALPNDDFTLRHALMRRLSAAGFAININQVLLTHGGLQAIRLAISSVCNSNDIIGIESPCPPSVLSCIDALGFKVIFIPADSATGLQPSEVKKAIITYSLSCIIVMPSFSIPTGSLMPVEAKIEMAYLVALHNIPLIEIDTYGDLAHNGIRPPTIKSFDGANMVTLCSSFSKTIMPEMGVGYVIAGNKFSDQNKSALFSPRTSNYFTASALTSFLVSGGYDRHLRIVQRLYAKQVAEMSSLLQQHMPPGTEVHTPSGGYMIWVTLPKNIDAYGLYRMAHMNNIIISPGNLFSHKLGNSHHILISAAHWPSGIEESIQMLGRFAAHSHCKTCVDRSSDQV
jgi:DNA-binding transcriptional MocR family regulator